MSAGEPIVATSERRNGILRLSPNALRALGRLQEGPATGLDLFRAGAGMRYGARLLELRRAGHQISKRCLGRDPEVWEYTLADPQSGKPEA